jgi:hypothetical protein
MFKAIKEFFTGKKVEEVQSTPPVTTMTPAEVPYKVEAAPKAEPVVEVAPKAEPVVEVAPVVAVEKPAKKTRIRSSTPKAAKTKK